MSVLQPHNVGLKHLTQCVAELSAKRKRQTVHQQNVNICPVQPVTQSSHSLRHELRVQ